MGTALWRFNNTKEEQERVTKQQDSPVAAMWAPGKHSWTPGTACLAAARYSPGGYACNVSLLDTAACQTQEQGASLSLQAFLGL